MQYIDVEQGSESWKELRCWVITGTKLQSVLWTDKVRKTLIYELIAEVIAPTPEWYKSAAMENWNIIEDIVMEQYPDAKKIGFIKKYEWLWISCDWVIEIDWKIKKAIEIKSPEPKAFVRYKMEWWIPPEYKAQVLQYYIVIEDLDELDFIIYNPTVKDPEYRKIVIHTTREQFTKEIAEAKEKLSSFRIEWQEALRKFITNP